jgi:hypothetical protein
MLNRAGRLELVRSTLVAIPIFAMMSLDVSAWVSLEGPEGCPWRPLFSGAGSSVYAERTRWIGYYKPPEDESCTQDSMAFVEPRGGLKAVEEV